MRMRTTNELVIPRKFCCYSLVVEMDFSEGFSLHEKMFQREGLKKAGWVACTHLERASASPHFPTGGEHETSSEPWQQEMNGFPQVCSPVAQDHQR